MKRFGKIGKNVLRNIKRQARRLPPPAEVGIGIAIVCIPPLPDPSDIVGYGLIADGIRRMHKERKAKFTNIKIHSKKKGSKNNSRYSIRHNRRNINRRN